MNAHANWPPPRVQQCGNVRIITFSDARDLFGENRIARQLEDATEGLEKSHLLLDFRKVKYIGSEELATLIALHRKIQAGGGRLTLFNLNARVHEVFAVTRLETYFRICRKSRAAPSE